MKTITSFGYPSDTHWTFPDPAAGVVRGTNLEDLVSNVADFRAANGIPAGDPGTEVIEYLCTHNPGLCKERRGPAPASGSPAPPASPERKFGDRVADWVAERASQPQTPVAPDVIRRRAAVCLGCPFNVPFKSGCSACQRRLTRAINRLTAGYPKRATDGLGACSHFVWSNALAVGSDIVMSKTVPANCWAYAG